MSFPDFVTQKDEHELIHIGTIQEQVSEIESRAERIENVQNIYNYGTVKKVGIFTAGVIIGDLGSALINEVAAKVYDYAIPIVSREISIFSAVVVTGVFAFYAVPVILTKICQENGS